MTDNDAHELGMLLLLCIIIPLALGPIIGFFDLYLTLRRYKRQDKDQKP